MVNNFPSVIPEFQSVINELENTEDLGPDQTKIEDGENEYLFTIDNKYFDNTVGKEVADIEVQTPSLTTKITCKDMELNGKILSMEGLHDNESIQIVI